MSFFYDAIKLRALAPCELRRRESKVQLWEVLAPIGYVTSAGPITVPAEFVSDFASVPRPAKLVIDDDDPRILAGSILHDYVYSRRGHMERGILTREQADGLLREAMLACGASALLAGLVYRAVRLGGAGHWKR